MKTQNINIRQRNRVIKFVALALLLTVCVVCAVFVLRGNRVDAINFQSNIEKKEYELGEELTIPSATFTVNDNAVDSQYKIVFPSEREYVSEKIKLTESGIVKIVYTATVDGKVYTNEERITVKQNLFTVEGMGSVECGVYSVKNYGLTALAQAADPNAEEVFEELSGAKVSISSGSVIKYNKAIDLTKLAKNEPLVSFTILPDKNGEPDFRRLNVRVTDVNNPDNYLILRVKDKEDDDGDYISYSMVGINSELQNYRNNTVNTSVYGIGAAFSFRGKPGMSGNKVIHSDRMTLTKDRFSFYVDEVENMVYKTDQGDTLYPVCDLVGCNVGWEGFSSGLVNIEIFADLYMNSNATFIIRDIENKQLDSNILKDGEGPNIFVDYESYVQNDLPKGLINHPYKIFAASAYDTVLGATDVDALVYKNYYSSSRVLINQADGAFIPKTSGIYTIEYKAKDNSQNESVVAVDIEVLSNALAIGAVLPEGYTTAALQGESISVASLTLSGGHGKVENSVSVLFGDKQVEIFDGKFRVLDAGTYKVKYSITDFVKQTKEVSYDVIVSNYNELRFVSDDIYSQLDKYYVCGLNYQIPKVQLYSFSGDGSYQVVDSTVAVSNGTISNGIYCPATEGENVFTFSYGGKSISVSKKVYNIKNGSDLDLKNTFICENAIVESGYAGDYVRYLATTNCELGFINAIPAENAKIKFNTEVANNKVGKIIIKLVDKYNSMQEVRFVFNVLDGSLYLSTNNSSAMTALGINLTGDARDDVSLSFSASKSSVTVGSLTLNVPDYYSGEKFEGFDSNLVYLSVELVNPVGTFSFVVKEVMNLSTSKNVKKDMLAPIINVLGEIGGRSDIGSTYTLPKVIATDVISPCLKTFTVSVYDKDGEFVKSVDGVELNKAPVAEYQFVIEKFGDYTIKYNAVDYSSKDEVYTKTISVLDLEAPKVTIDGKAEVSAKIGGTVKLQKIEVSDNLSTAEQITIEKYIKDPTGKVTKLAEDSFSPSLAGQYVVYYYVYDSYDYSSGGISQGNLTVVSYICNVN